LLLASSVVPGYISETKASWLPSCENTGTRAPPERFGEALRLAAGGEIQRIQLRHVVVVTLRAEHDAAAVRAPHHAAFRPARRREAAARVARGGVDEPQVAELALSSYDGSTTDTTIQRPSGLTCGAPTRFMSQMSSCVGVRLSAAEARPASPNAANNNHAQCRFVG
jgi:hypothetical protein